MTQIKDLPDELLLEIACRIRGKYRNSNLANLALVSRRFRPIAQEALLQEPSLKLTEVGSFVLQMSRKDWVIPKICSLELWSAKKDRYVRHAHSNHNTLQRTSRLNLRIYIDFLLSNNNPRYTKVPCPPELRTLLDREACLDTIKRFSDKPAHVDLWMAALEDDVLQGLLGILLVSLPNLKKLHCAAMWLMDFPLLARTLSAGVTVAVPHTWKHEYLAGVMNTIAPKLEILEIPTSCTRIFFSGRMFSVFNYLYFTGLKELNVPMALLDLRRTRRFSLHPSAAHLLPPSLQVLRISEGRASVRWLIEDICKARKNGNKLQTLECIDIFYCSSHDKIMADSVELGCQNLLQDLRSLCSDAQLRISLYFPSTPLRTCDVNRSIWSLRDNQEIMQSEWQVYCQFYNIDLSEVDSRDIPRLEQDFLGSRKEFNFDVDGDIEMLGG